MARKYSQMTAQAIREADQCGIYAAVRLHDVSVLLDRIEDAEDVPTLRRLLSEFITMQTGIK